MIHPLLSQRRSIRAFSDRTIDDATIVRLFEAARWAPSSFNEQPWRFIFARRGEPAFDKMVDCLNESNRIWARKGALLIMPVALLLNSRNHQLNRHAFHDVGLAVGNLTVEATVSGLFMHQMGGFDLEKARISFEVPTEFEPVSIIVIGYPGDPEQLPEQLRARELLPRNRKNLDELIFAGRFGSKSPSLTQNNNES